MLQPMHTLLLTASLSGWVCTDAPCHADRIRAVAERLVETVRTLVEVPVFEADFRA
jgi:hypothetical protein